MLKDKLWLQIAKKEDILCFLCAEKKLGRQLTWQDLKRPCFLDRHFLIALKLYLQSSVENQLDMLQALRKLNEEQDSSSKNDGFSSSSFG